ncbi:MAG TPA: hypothetical protein VJA94_25500 [Candidatus Angelobacter sp.]
MKSGRVSLGLFCCLFLLVLPILAASPKQQPAAKATPTVGISVSLPDGSSEVVPVQKRASSIIPTPGAKGVFGVQLQPYMSGQKVAVKISAVTGDNWTASLGPTLQKAHAKATRALGSYVIGKTGDSIQLADLAEFGLPSLTLKVVKANLSAKSCSGDADPCLLCDNGDICCWTTVEEHEYCLAACGGGVKPHAATKKNH